MYFTVPFPSKKKWGIAEQRTSHDQSRDNGPAQPKTSSYSSRVLFITMATYYSLDSAITSFFESNTTATRQQCDDFTLSRMSGTINPVPIQGTFSYTLTVGSNESKLFQFRVQDSHLDLDMMNLAKAVQPQFVVSCKYHGAISQPRPLHIYEMDKIPGTSYIMARYTSTVQPPDAVFRQRNTVKDLARYGRTSSLHFTLG